MDSFTNWATRKACRAGKRVLPGQVGAVIAENHGIDSQKIRQTEPKLMGWEKGSNEPVTQQEIWSRSWAWRTESRGKGQEDEVRKLSKPNQESGGFWFFVFNKSNTNPQKLLNIHYYVENARYLKKKKKKKNSL